MFNVDTIVQQHYALKFRDRFDDYGEEDKKTDNISSLDDNYKTLYEMELKKNDELLQELKKYQDLISDLKEVLK